MNKYNFDMLQKNQRTSGKEFSNVPGGKKGESNESQGCRSRRDRTINPSIFISKTFEILQNQQYCDIVRWNPDGLTFIIDDVERFEREILPIYFRHRNFSSFVRQLNMYDFHKIRNEANSNIFEHKEFRRHCQHNLKNIKRKGCQSKKNLLNEDSNEENKDIQPISSKKLVGRSKATVENSDTFIPKSGLGCASLYSIPNNRNKNVSPANSPSRRELIDDFLNSLPEIINNERDMEQMVRQMKNNPKYSCLTSKEDLKRIVRKIKLSKMKKNFNHDDLEQLSIEEEIIVQNIDRPVFSDPSLVIFSTEKCLPHRSQSLIDSLNYAEDVEGLLYNH